MADYPDTYIEYVRQTKIGEKIDVHFKVPIPMQGGVQFPGDGGTLLWVFDDGYLIRTEQGEKFFAFKDLQFALFPSQIQTAKTGLIGMGASA